MKILQRNNVKITGNGERTILFAHGFGCDQKMWRFVAPAFEGEYRTVVFDQVGAGNSRIDQYEVASYASLDRYAEDVLEICSVLDIKDCIYVGHSVASMIGVLAALKAPGLFSKMVLIGPSPCYVNRGSYIGGFDASEMDYLLEVLDANYVAWARAMAPTIMGNLDRPELGAELSESFCRADPVIARQFARVTFLSDNREDLEKLVVPTLILQCSEDPIAPELVGKFVHSRIQGSSYIQLRATGHCPNMSSPDETIAAIRTFV
ncbi:alpha/beta fold hydrolase [Noviherbaspirillum pedocola]|uniref:alpha/beta fold hydrolase n=1 Tax=Noviherbaspirillum pedocola TaxID=2801341 RepID=UPI002D804550|nr:alpha/beta hydrolase [Noviherbaspirillum pedocola]